MYHCVQVRVQYAKVPYKNGTNAKSINDNDWVDLRRIDVVENKVSYSPNKNSRMVCNKTIETVDAAMSSGILKAKQKLGVTFNFDESLI